MEVPRVYAAHSIAPKREPLGGPDSPDLVVIGAASRDITPDDPRGWRLGGSAAYCALAAARLGLRVGCLLGVDAEASAAHELSLLEAAGVDLRRVALERGPVFENIERDGHRRQRWLSECAPLAPAALPKDWRGARGWLLVPIAGELPGEWSAAPKSDAVIGVGWQGMLRKFAADGWVRGIAPELSTLLAAAGLVVASVNDLPSGATIASLRMLAPQATIVLTAGERGGVVVHLSGLTRYRAIPATAVVDPTGAGDVFLAALMVGWLLKGGPTTSATLRFAAAAASCVVEGPGLSAVPTQARVAERLG